MGLVIPLGMLDKREYVSRLLKAKDDAFKLAKTLIDATDLVIRPLKPSDLGVSGNEWTFNVSSGNNSIVTEELDNKTLIVIFGIYNLSTNPQVNEVKFGTPARTTEDVYIEDMYMYDNPGVIIEKPVTFQPGSTIEITAVAKGSNTAEKLGFVGFVIEPAGRTIGAK